MLAIENILPDVENVVLKNYMIHLQFKGLTVSVSVVFPEFQRVINLEN